MSERRPDVIVVGGGIVGAAAAAFLADGGARVTIVERRGARLGRLGREFGRRPASVRPDPGGALSRDRRALPGPVRARPRLPVGRRAGRAAVRVERRDGGPRRGPGAGRGVPRAAARRGRRRDPRAARAGARAGAVGLPGRDRLPGPAGRFHLCLCDARRTARGDHPAGPRGDARRPRRHGRPGSSSTAGRWRPTRSSSRPGHGRPPSSTRPARGGRSANAGASSSSWSSRPDRPTSSRRPRSARPSAPRRHEADPDLADFSLVPLAGIASVGSTFLAREPDPAAWVEPILRRASRVRPGRRRRSDPRDARVRPAAERRRATAHRPGRGPARAGRVRRTRVVGDLDRTRLGATGRGPDPRPRSRRSRPSSIRRGSGAPPSG